MPPATLFPANLLLLARDAACYSISANMVLKTAFLTTSCCCLLLSAECALLQVKYAEDQDFFYAQYTSLYSNLASLGYKNNEIVAVTGTNRRRRAAGTAGH
jgi:hypothetical protein